MNWSKRRATLPDEKVRILATAFPSFDWTLMHSCLLQGRFYEVVKHSTGDPTFVPKALKLPVGAQHLRSTVRPL